MNYHNVLTRSWNIRRNIIFVSITCMVSTLTLLASTALADRTYAGRLIYGHGKIDRLTSMDGQHQPITTDNVIRPGDIIRTGPNGRAAILCADESLIRLHSNTALSFEHVAQTAVWIDPADRADGVSAKRASTYQLMAGELWLRNKSRHLVITVKAAHLNATLRGTELDLLMLPENVVAMTVQEGLVIASNRHGSMGVKQLEKIIARPGEPIEKQMLLSSEGTVQWTLTIPFLPGFLETPLLSYDPMFLRAEREKVQVKLSQDPADMRLTLQLAKIYSDLGLLTEGESLFKDILRKTNSGEQLHSQATVGLAWIYIRRNHSTDALKLLSADDEPGPENFLERSAAYAKMGAMDTAKEILASARKRHPDFAPFDSQTAKILIAEKRFDAAERILEHALKKQPNDAFSWSLLGLSKLIQGKKSAAAQAADKGVANAPNATFSLLIQSYVHQACFRYDTALAVTQRILDVAPDNVLARVHLAQLKFAGGYTRDADRIIQKALVTAPESAIVHNTYGFVRLARRRIEEAARAFEEAIHLDASLGEPHLGLGLIHMRNGREEKAMEALSKAVLLEPNRSIYLSYWAKMLYQLKRFDKALDMLDKAAALDPDDPTPHYYKSLILNDLNQPAEAITSLHTAIALNDNRAVYRSRFMLDRDLSVKNVDLAYIYKRLGLTDWAINKAIAAVKGDFSNSSAHSYLGSALFNTEDRLQCAMNEQLLGTIMQPTNQNSFNTFNTYTSFFESPEMHVTVTGETGSQDTCIGNVFLHGWVPRFSAAFDLDATYSENSELEDDDEKQFQKLLRHTIKWDVSENDHIFFEVYKADFDMGYGGVFGNSQNSFLSSEDMYFSEKKIDYEVGFHHQFSPVSDLIIYAAVLKRPYKSNVYVDLGPSDPALPDVSLQAQTFLKDEIVTYQLQAQQMIKTPSHQLSLGGIHLWGNENADYDTLFYLSFQGDSYPQTTMTTHSRMNNKSSSFYIRDLWRITDRLMLDSALYYDQIRNTSAVSNTKWDIDLIGPRVGVIYSLTERDTLRLAGFRYLVPFATDRVDSPEIAGIPIFRYTMEGTIANEANGVWEHEWQTGCVTSGVYYVEKKMEQYLGSAADQEKTVDNGSLKGVYASVNQLVPGGCGAAATYHFWETKDDILSPATGCGHCVDHLATIGVKYVAPIGFSTGIKEIYRHTNFRKDSRDSESIFITDIEMGYELPNKHARIRFQVENLFDDTFNWVATLGPWARHPTRQWLLSVECDI